MKKSRKSNSPRRMSKSRKVSEPDRLKEIRALADAIGALTDYPSEGSFLFLAGDLIRSLQRSYDALYYRFDVKRFSSRSKCDHRGCKAASEWVVDPHGSGHRVSIACTKHLAPVLNQYLSAVGESWSTVTRVGAKAARKKAT